MGISAKPVILQLRGGPEHKVYGDPYTWSCIIQICGNSAYVSGLCGTLELSSTKTFLKLLKDYGITQIFYERNKQPKELELS